MNVRFTECSDSQVNFAGKDDSREHLVLNEVYELHRKEVHSWHTLYFLKGFPGLSFNSVCFREEDPVKSCKERIEDKITCDNCGVEVVRNGFCIKCLSKKERNEGRPPAGDNAAAKFLSQDFD